MTHSFAHRPRGAGWGALRIAGMVVIGVFFATLFALVFGFLVKGLWNWLMPELFGLSTVTYWQAFGILILGKLIFGGPHPHHERPPKPVRDRLRRWHGVPRAGEDTPDPERFDRFWQEEGRKAFDDYMSRVNGQSGDKG